MLQQLIGMSIGLLAAIGTAATQQALPVAFPNKTVEIIVSGPPGGGLDIVARLLADGLQRRFGDPFVIENRSGAGGNVGAEVVASAELDGHTLLAAQPAALTTNVFLFKSLRFDPGAFEPLAIMISIPNTVAVRDDLSVRSIKELIVYAKENPAQLNYGSQGIGSTPHLTTELFARLTGTKLTHVPYRGTVQAVNDLVGRHVDTLFIQLDAVREHYRANRVGLLAVATEHRVASVPELPAAIEEGVAGFTSITWNALLAPPKTPASIVAELNQSIKEIMRSPDTVEPFRTLSLEPVGRTPGEAKGLIRRETVGRSNQGSEDCCGIMRMSKGGEH